MIHTCAWWCCYNCWYGHLFIHCTCSCVSVHLCVLVVEQTCNTFTHVYFGHVNSSGCFVFDDTNLLVYTIDLHCVGVILRLRAIRLEPGESERLPAHCCKLIEQNLQFSAEWSNVLSLSSAVCCFLLIFVVQLRVSIMSKRPHSCPWLPKSATDLAHHKQKLRGHSFSTYA